MEAIEAIEQPETQQLMHNCVATQQPAMQLETPEMITVSYAELERVFKAANDYSKLGYKPVGMDWDITSNPSKRKHLMFVSFLKEQNTPVSYELLNRYFTFLKNLEVHDICLRAVRSEKKMATVVLGAV